MTGGQSSLAHFQNDLVINLTVAALIIVGGLGFAVYQELLYRWRHRGTRNVSYSLHTRIILWMTFWLLLLGTVAFLVTEWTNTNTLGPMSIDQKILTAFFQSVTFRTAGFSTLDFNELRSITLLIGGMWMFIGASPGGTGGGVKTTTFATTLVAVRSTLLGKRDAEVFNRRLSSETIFRALVLIFVSFGVIVAGIFMLTFTEPAALREAGVGENLFMRLQFEALSAFGTVGLSTGITPYLSDSGRLIIMVMMFIGRLGPITAATALSAPAPKLHRRLPEEDVALG